MFLRIDHNSPISVRQQIRAGLVQQIARGDLGVGDPLPSIRDLADHAGIAPMTVTRVYADLKQGGLIEARTGSGTFVTESALSRLGRTGAAAGLWTSIDALIADATQQGIGLADLVSLVASRDRSGHAIPKLVMVGLFSEATRSYAARVTMQIGTTVSPIALLDDARDDAALAAHLSDADLILTFANLRDRLAALAPNRDIVSLRFIPSEETRLALAALEPLATVVVVSRFADFLPVLSLGVRRFAAHVQTVTAREMSAADLPALLATADVVVMSTGAETAADLAPAGTTRIEYRHVPDPGDIDRLVVPRLVAAASSSPSRKEAS